MSSDAPRATPTSATSEASILQVTAGVIVRAGEVLVCQRAVGARHAGKWEFPGGKREADETPPECLRRELDEELGIAAEIGDLLWRQRHCYPSGRPFELFFYLVTSYEGDPDNRAFAEIRWVPLGRLGELDFLEADRDFVARLDRGEWNFGGSA